MEREIWVRGNVVNIERFNADGSTFRYAVYNKPTRCSLTRLARLMKNSEIYVADTWYETALGLWFGCRIWKG